MLGYGIYSLPTIHQEACLKSCRIILVDEHELSRLGLVAALASCSHIDIVVQSDDSQSAVLAAEQLRPDIAILSVKGRDGNSSLQTSTAIRRASPVTKIVMLAMDDNLDDFQAAVQAGVAGYALKTIGREDLLKLIANIATGQTSFNSDLMQRLLHRFSEYAAEEMGIKKLTARELDILRQLTTGRTNKEIAKQLAISPGTVKVHIERILTKLRVADRTEAAVLAVRTGVLDRTETA